MKQQVLQTSLIKCIEILELLIKRGETGVSDIGREKNLNRSNVHRILSTFEFLGYVEKDPRNRKFRPTLKLFELGHLVLQKNGLIKTSHPFLEKLGAKFGETSNLAVLDKGDVIYIDKVESSEALKTDLAIGRHVPAYCTALGKILLAGSDEEFLKQYFREMKLQKRTPKTISKETLAKQLVEVREKGFAIDNEELCLGIRCIAAPIKNHSGNVIAAISLAGPSTRMTPKKLDSVKRPIIDTASDISQELGFRMEGLDTML